jgi:hypothetical protein
MEIGGKQTMSKSTGKQTMRKDSVYRIVVRSELNGRYAVAFEGMEMETKNGDTIITGEVIDQSHLHGILNRINGLGLRLLSVQALPDHVHTGHKGKRDQEEQEL